MLDNGEIGNYEGPDRTHSAFLEDHLDLARSHEPFCREVSGRGAPAISQAPIRRTPP